MLGKKDAGRGEVVVAFVMQREGSSVSAEELRVLLVARGWHNGRSRGISLSFPICHAHRLGRCSGVNWQSS